MIGSVSGVVLDDVLRCHRRIEPLVDAVELNISSPNTSGLRIFQEPHALSELLDRLNHDRKRPLFVKLPPYDVGGELSERRERVMALADVCVRRGVDGLTVANTHPMEDARLAVGKGGLSGRAIFERTVAMVADVRAEIGSGAAINASGGIFTGEDAWRAIKAGATTVQLLTGFLYRGPWNRPGDQRGAAARDGQGRRRVSGFSPTPVGPPPAPCTAWPPGLRPS